MNAADIMTRNVLTVAPDTPVAQVAQTMLDRRVSALPVVEAGRVVGMISEGDLLRRVETGTEPRGPRWLELLMTREALATEYIRSHGHLARDVMTQPVVTVSADTPLAELAELMDWRQIKRVPVLDASGGLLGIVSRADLLRGLASRAAGPSRVSVDDQVIRENVLAELRHQGWARHPADGDVMVEDGVVHLWGLVRAPQIRQAMIVAARDVPGVRAVEDHMDRERAPDAMTWSGWPTPPPL
ncbi:MAG: CBS domain-containing protein [Rhodospirillales bacterium]|nr:CBS domain-containing protein [Rhodospirillales bacterium]MDE2199142.1 CBS domain-containing protein [Rhodospirillales bacterium]MDE2574804.1 CBS domain-containing protein [Rhodospirillales bacterium]